MLNARLPGLTFGFAAQDIAGTAMQDGAFRPGSNKAARPQVSNALMEGQGAKGKPFSP